MNIATVSIVRSSPIILDPKSPSIPKASITPRGVITIIATLKIPVLGIIE